MCPVLLKNEDYYPLKNETQKFQAVLFGVSLRFSTSKQHVAGKIPNDSKVLILTFALQSKVSNKI